MTSNPHPAPSPDLPPPPHLLVVEDDIIQRHTLSEALRTHHYIVYEAATADEASMLLASPAMDIHLVITDIWLPGMIDGLDLFDYVSHAYPDKPVIVTSGIYKKESLQKSVPFFQKPFDIGALSQQIDKMLKERGAK